MPRVIAQQQIFQFGYSKFPETGEVKKSDMVKYDLTPKDSYFSREDLAQLSANDFKNVIKKTHLFGWWESEASYKPVYVSPDTIVPAIRTTQKPTREFLRLHARNSQFTLFGKETSTRNGSPARMLSEMLPVLAQEGYEYLALAIPHRYQESIDLFLEKGRRSVLDGIRYLFADEDFLLLETCKQLNMKVLCIDDWSGKSTKGLQVFENLKEAILIEEPRAQIVFFMPWQDINKNSYMVRGPENTKLQLKHLGGHLEEYAPNRTLSVLLVDKEDEYPAPAFNLVTEGLAAGHCVQTDLPELRSVVLSGGVLSQLDVLGTSVDAVAEVSIGSRTPHHITLWLLNEKNDEEFVKVDFDPEDVAQMILDQKKIILELPEIQLNAEKLGVEKKDAAGEVDIEAKDLTSGELRAMMLQILTRAQGVLDRIEKGKVIPADGSPLTGALYDEIFGIGSDLRSLEDLLEQIEENSKPEESDVDKKREKPVAQEISPQKLALPIVHPKNEKAGAATYEAVENPNSKHRVEREKLPIQKPELEQGSPEKKSEK